MITFVSGFFFGGAAGALGLLIYQEYSNPVKQLRRAQSQLQDILAREKFEAEQRAKDKDYLINRVKELNARVNPPGKKPPEAIPVPKPVPSTNEVRK